MTELLFFKEIHIRQMYGSDFALSLTDLSRHLNIVFGPNGAGKTTLSNALNAILLSSDARKFHLHGTAELLTGNQTLRVDVKHTRSQYRREGKSLTKSELSNLHRPKSYHLSLQDLLPETHSDGDLAQEIIKQANGGFDITQAGDASGFDHKKRYYKTTESKEFERTQNKLREVRQEQRLLQDQKNQREQLHSLLDASKQAKKRLNVIIQVKKWLDAENEYSKASDDAQSYPAVIRAGHDLTDVVQKVQELQNKLTQLNRDANVHRKSIESTEKQLSQNRLPSSGLELGELKLLESHVHEVSAQSRKLDDLRQICKSHKEQAREAWESLGGIVNSEWKPVFSPDHLRHLQRYAKEAASYQNEKQSLRSINNLLEASNHDDANINREDLRGAQQILIDWILTLKNDSPQVLKVRKFLVISIVLSTLVSLIIGIVFHPIGYSGLLISALTYWIYTLLPSNEKPQITSKQLEVLRRLLPELPHEPDMGSVNSELNQFIEICALSRLNEFKSDERLRNQASMKQLIEREEELGTRKEELIRSLGLDEPPSDMVSLIELVDRILQWRKLHHKAKELTSQHTIASNHYEDLLEQARNLFAKYGYEQPTDSFTAKKLWAELKHDNDSAQRDSDQLNREKKIWTDLRNNLKQLESHYRQHFTDLKLEPGDLQGLVQCAKQFADWSKAASRAKELQIIADRLKSDLPEGYESIVGSEDLDQALELAEQESANEDDIQKKLTLLDNDIKSTEEGNSLENAIAENEEKRSRLESIRDEKAAKEIGYVILNKLHENAIHNAPLVFERAQENFQFLTENRYALQIPSNNIFRARDHQTKRDFELTELSSATRVQLLLSVRLAFVETGETRYRLPLTLDETLANSDDVRASAIITTMASLAEDRQIFYFTAQNDEVNKWKEIVPKDLLKVHYLN